MIITNSKAKKKGAHFEHLNYHLLSILIVAYHDLLSLPEKITGLWMWDYDGKLIDASEKIKDLEFKAGKVYNLTISKGVRKKNTNSRSIAMSVRCVSE